MIKSIQNKIVLIFYVIGIIIIVGLGLFFVNIINTNAMLVNNTGDIAQITNLQKEQIKILILSAILVFSCIVIVVWFFVSKVIVIPMNKLVKNAEKIAKGENVDLIRPEDLKKKRKLKRKSEVDELTHIISLITGELREKLGEVKRQKNEIEIIFKHINDGILAFDSEGRITHINPAAIELLNIENEKTFLEVFKKLNLDIKMETIMYLKSWAEAEQRINIGNKTVNIFFAPYKDENELLSGVIAVIQDITEHVRLDNMRKEFVADVSHELKTPITSIIGYADTLLDEDYDKETQSKFLSVISSEGNRMANLVSDLLTLSRYDTNRVTREVTEFDLGELTKRCQEKLEIEIDKKHQEVECFVTADVPKVKADKAGIERVILNVLSNAVKYTKENGIIKIYVGFVYNDAYIKIIDNGIGIPKEDMPRIFERFYRVDKARSREMGGTGLGLSIAKEIIEQNKGSIDVKSEYGKGTEVVIRVPVDKNK